jgi:MFS family permease
MWVGVAPVVGAFANQLPRRAFLVAMDLVRAAIALLLPFITEVWQVYVLIFLLQSASAAFTPTFQATIPDVLPDEREYTRALSLSRLAYDLESLLSPGLSQSLKMAVEWAGRGGISQRPYEGAHPESWANPPPFLGSLTNFATGPSKPPPRPQSTN